MNGYAPDVVTGLMVLVPPGAAPTDVTNMDVNVAGPPGQLQPSSAVATWPQAVSLSWAQDRPHDWLRVLEVADALRAPPFDGDSTSWKQEATVQGLEPPWAGSRWLRATVLPHLGVTVVELHGLDQTTVTVVAGRLYHLPTEVRLLTVHDDGAHAFTERSADEAERQERERDQELGGEG
jgi:hypothetical protein